jgi:hypothetical protein
MISRIISVGFLLSPNLMPLPPSNFFAHVDTQFHTPIHAFQTDNGKEFVNHASTTFFDSRGIQLRILCPYSSLQNGKAERATAP